MRPKDLFYLLSLFVCVWRLSGQVDVSGRVVTSIDKPVPFASVSLKNERDSSLVFTGITDLEGAYTFEAVKVGPYRLDIQCFGYKPITRSLRITLPSSEHFIHLRDSLEDDGEVLGEVVVTGVRSRQEIDHRVLHFDKKTLKEALHSYDLLKTLPQIQVDISEDKIKGSLGGAVQILINGVRATPNDVRMIPKESIKRVELYDVPPARYRYVEVVINIITSSLENGYIVGGSVSHAVNAGFSNDNIYASLIRGKHKMSLEYALNYRNYRDREALTKYSYPMGSSALDVFYHSNENFGYTTHTPALKYAYVQEERALWELSLKPNFEYRFSDRLGKGSYLLDGIETQSIGSEGSSRIKLFNPSLDLYHWRKIGGKDELSVNAVATLFSTKRNTSSKETDNSSGLLGLEDFMDLDNGKRSIILELAHKRAVGTLRWSNGYRGEFASLSSLVFNHYEKLDYRSHSYMHYAYSEVSGRHKRLLYRISLGLTHSTNTSDYRVYRQLSFTPKFMLGYTIGKRSTMRLMYDVQPNFPDVNSLSSNRERLSRDITSSGNPKLENELLSKITGLYNYQNGVFDLSLVGAYIYTKRPHLWISERKASSYIHSPINGSWDKTIAGGIKASVKPFRDNRLKFNLLLLPSRSEMCSELFSYTQHSLHTEFDASVQHKGLDLLYKLVLPGYGARSGYASRTEAAHTLYLGYKLQNWKFFGSMSFIGMSARYHTYTLGSPIVYTSTESWIHDNKNMLSLGVSYHLSSGKDRTYTKSLNNQDTGTPTL